MDDLLM